MRICQVQEAGAEGVKGDNNLPLYGDISALPKVQGDEVKGRVSVEKVEHEKMSDNK